MMCSGSSYQLFLYFTLVLAGSLLTDPFHAILFGCDLLVSMVGFHLFRIAREGCVAVAMGAGRMSISAGLPALLLVSGLLVGSIPSVGSAAEVEPNDSAAQANPVVLAQDAVAPRLRRGAMPLADIGTDGNNSNDWYRFDAQAGDRVTVSA